MIDIEKAEEEFKRYVSNYDINDSRISMKFYHTFRVEGICEQLAILLKLNEEKANLAKLIGLLHDIARFEQYTRYKTYDDLKSIDHGDLGVEILKKDGYIRRYIKTNEYDDIIFKAIKYHNKYSIPNGLSSDEEMSCKIIRDADKLDIFYVKIKETLKKEKELVEEQLITKEVLEQFMRKETVHKKYVKNNIDRIIVLIAFIYDFNYKECYGILEKNKYIDEIINMFDYKKTETKKQMELIKKIANDYINNKVRDN